MACRSTTRSNTFTRLGMVETRAFRITITAGLLARMLSKELDKLGLADETLARTAYPRASENPREFFLRWMSEGLNGDKDGMPFGSRFGFERTYWSERHRSNVLMVHYRDLKSDLFGEMQRIARFGDHRPGSAVAHSPSSRLVRGDEAPWERAANDCRSALIGGAETFFQRGENDRWRGVLTDDDNAQYEARVRESFEPECATWLLTGRLGLSGDTLRKRDH